MSTISIEVYNRDLTFTNMPTITAESAGVDSISFEFKDSTWNNYATCCVFFKNETEYHSVSLDEKDTVKFPTEILKKKGLVYFGLCGENETTRLTSTILTYKIKNGVYCIGTPEDESWAESNYSKIVQRLESVEHKIDSFAGIYFNVKDYGAMGDGKTDDGRAIQSALDSCRDAGGGIVYFPSGTYCISKTVFFYSNQLLTGEPNTVLKRIKNEEDSTSTCGCFLCNWFDEADTKYNGSKIACENVEISNLSFDMSGDIGVVVTATGQKTGTAPINTCHAKNIYIHNCTFVRNYTAHCIEINSSDDVYIENCTFSDYVATGSQEYNEMIQIDKAVNAALGGKYTSSGIASLIGYNATTRIAPTNSSSNRPDYRPCNNINIYNCRFYTMQYCCAIGNHHAIASNDTVGQQYNITKHSNINIHDNLFEGNTGARGHITFDTFTTNVNIYNNVFNGGTCAIATLTLNSNTIAHDNKINDCDKSFSGDIFEYDNIVNGSVIGLNNSIGDIDELSVFLDGFELYDGFSWVFSGEVNGSNREYTNENITQFRGIGLQSLQMCIWLNEAITDDNWHPIGKFKDGCRLNGSSPFTFSIPTSSGKSILVLISSKNHYDISGRNQLYIKVPDGSLAKGTFLYISKIMPCETYEDNITVIENGFILNSNFMYRLEGEYLNSTVHTFANAPFEFLQICFSPKSNIASGTSWTTIGTLNSDCQFSSETIYTFSLLSANGVPIACRIIPNNPASTANSIKNTIQIRPLGASSISTEDHVYLCVCIDRDNTNNYYNKVANAISLNESKFQWGTEGTFDEYQSSSIIRFGNARLEKINLVFEQKDTTLSSDEWHTLGTIAEGCRLGGCSPFTTMGYSGNGIPLLVAVFPDTHYNSEIRNQIKIRPLTAITKDTSLTYKHRITVSMIVPCESYNELYKLEDVDEFKTIANSDSDDDAYSIYNFIETLNDSNTINGQYDTDIGYHIYKVGKNRIQGQIRFANVIASNNYHFSPLVIKQEYRPSVKVNVAIAGIARTPSGDNGNLWYPVAGYINNSGSFNVAIGTQEKMGYVELQFEYII